MECPRCSLTLTNVLLRQSEAEYCKCCRGVFLTRGAIKKLFDLMVARFSNQRLDHLGRRTKVAVSSILCPRCRTPSMSVHNFHKITLDVCPSCGGIWFDHGELNASERMFREKHDWENDNYRYTWIPYRLEVFLLLGLTTMWLYEWGISLVSEIWWRIKSWCCGPPKPL